MVWGLGLWVLFPLPSSFLEANSNPILLELLEPEVSRNHVLRSSTAKRHGALDWSSAAAGRK